MDNQTAPNIMSKDTYVTHCRGTTFKMKNVPTGFDSSNMYIEEMVSEKTNSEGLFEKKPFSSQR